MAFHGGRPLLLLIYGLLAITGFLPQSSGFVALIALPIELLFLILLYSFRPKRLHRHPYPRADAILGGSVVMLLFYWFFAAVLGNSMDHVIPGPDHNLMLSPFILNAKVLIFMCIGYLITVLMDFRALTKHPETWTRLPQRLFTKGLSIWILAYVGIVAVWVTGEDYREWAVACLMMGRIAVEFALRPMDEEGAGVWSVGK